MYSEYFETGSKKGRGWRDHLKVHPAADLFPLLSETDPAALKDLSDGEIFYILKNGKGQMPPDGGRTKPEDLWNMVILVRSFAKK